MVRFRASWMPGRTLCRSSFSPAAFFFLADLSFRSRGVIAIHHFLPSARRQVKVCPLLVALQGHSFEFHG
ncbi:hypothetical protein D3C81_664630 [compost metagenome]